MPNISEIFAKEILDSRGNPTIQTRVTLDNGIIAVSAVPSGASTGAFEAYELRDGDEKRFQGKGVLKAASNVNSIFCDALIGKNPEDQKDIDDTMIRIDGTENKSRLGANAMLGISMSVCRAAAIAQGKALFQYMHDAFFSKLSYTIPIPMFNIVNGGKHADSGLCIQEFKIVPAGIKTYPEQLRAGAEIFSMLKRNLARAGYSVSVGDEGGFAPKFRSNEYAMEMIHQAIVDSGYLHGVEVYIGIDVAANSFYNKRENRYELQPENKFLSRTSIIEMYKEWIRKYHILSIEDGLHEEDWEGWRLFLREVQSLNRDIMLIGDDLLVTNPKRLKRAIEEYSCNSVLIKPNQIGTVSETVETILMAKHVNMRTVISHRSGETTDTFIADLAVGSGSEFMKSGAPSRGERVCKYNRLLDIAENFSN